jgi:hypothetical protein
LSTEGELLEEWGSRSLPWRIYLGLLSTQASNSEDVPVATANFMLKI